MDEIAEHRVSLMPKHPPAPSAKAAPSTKAPRKTGKPPLPPGPPWTRAQRAALAGSRRPHPLDPPPPPRTRDDGFQRLLEVERTQDELCRPVQFYNAAAEALYEPIRSLYAHPTNPTTKLEPSVERLRADLLHTHPVQSDVDPAWQALLAFWVDTEGLGFVFDVCNAPEPYSYMTHGLTRILVGPPDATDSRGYGWGRMSSLSRELRRLLFALPEDAFAKARDEAMDWLHRRPAGDMYAQRDESAAIAYTLARDPTLAHAITREMLDKNTSGAYGYLLASITDLSLAREFVDRYAMQLDIDGAVVALDVVETFGRDAAELFDTILAAAAKRSRPIKPFFKRRLEATRKLALADPRPPTP
jgi:hypothetical protein